jgi:glycosyltransferase involved in cell wall biosynthesis
MKEDKKKYVPPFFSIIIPVYNVNRYIEECLNSILTQSFQYFEIILVNDGSTDGSEEICDKYELNNHSVKVIHKLNSGTASARNAGMQVANGEYLWFIDSDDLITETALFSLYELLKLNENIAVLNFTKKDFQDGEFPDKTINPSFFAKKSIQNAGNNEKRMPSSVCFSLYNRKFIFDLGLDFKRDNQFEDEYFNLQLYANYKFTVLLVEIPFYLYRRRNENNKTSLGGSVALYEKCISKIELYSYVSSIEKNSFNEAFLNYKKRIYAEYALNFFEMYLRSNCPLQKRELIKIIKERINYIPFAGRFFKRNRIKKVLYNLNVNLFVNYIKLVVFLKKQ